MKILIIANPAAGKGRAVEKIQALARILIAKDCHVETYVTSQSGDAQQRVSHITHDIDCVVATGGDGTLNEVINGLPEPGQTLVSIFPTGTANVLAKELSLTNDPHLSAKILLNKKIRSIDMGTIGKRRFLLFVSAGFDALVTKELLHSKSRLKGYERYAIPVLKSLYHYRIPHLNVTLDNDISMDAGLVLISNTKSYGGIFTVTDKAECDSQYFDTCIVPDARIFSLIRFFLYALFNKVRKVKKIRFYNAKEIIITSKKPVPIQVDGDYSGTTPVTIQLSSAQIPVLVP